MWHNKQQSQYANVQVIDNIKKFIQLKSLHVCVLYGVHQSH